MTPKDANPPEVELDLARYELRRGGRVQKLEKLPLELLTVLAERRGHLVTRAEIVERLWGKDVFVDADAAINTAVRKVRRALGARAFGSNYFTLGPGIIGREHDHAESGMEEVYFGVRGSGTMRVDGEEIELRPRIFLRVDGESTRVPVSGDDGLEFVTFGAPLDHPYEPPDWG
jgi:mannose-6-phosphate isomerase-like protein (cupin superfamily)